MLIEANSSYNLTSFNYGKTKINNSTKSFYTLTRDGDLEPMFICVQENLTANICLNNNWEDEV